MGTILENIFGFIIGAFENLYKLATNVELTEQQEHTSKKIKKIYRLLANIFALILCFAIVTYFCAILYDWLGSLAPFINNIQKKLGLEGYRLPPQVGLILLLLFFAMYIAIVWVSFSVFRFISMYEFSKFWIFIEILNIVFGYPFSKDGLHSSLLVEMLEAIRKLL